jgi:ABC-type Fe3+/spermidine/putrescine transport system ATPase subunit
MTEVVMRAEDVHKNFGRLEVLKGVSLEVTRGETVCIIGPSGSGKTTFIRCINHLEKIDSGRIEVNGHLIGYRQKNGKLVEDSERNIARQRTEIGMVFQRFNLFPHKTALENVIEAPVHVLGTPKDQAAGLGKALLDRVGLALGRAAAAGRDRAGARDGACADAVRRADERARSGGDRRGALGDGGARSRRDDDDRRHARDGLRAQGSEPRRDDGRRADHRGRHSRALLRRAQARAHEAVPFKDSVRNR